MVLSKNQKLNQDARKIVSLISDDDISYLISQGLITSTISEKGDSITYQPTDRVIELVKTKKDYFDLFYETYPVYVLRPDGTKGFLRTNVNKCRKLFNSYVGSSTDMAEHLIDCLSRDVYNKIKTGKLGYMKTMWKWLCDHQWEEIEEEILASEESNNSSTYGTELI